jgi:WD40 repeat protein/tetratricopeptide (TPR) repeat protein
MATNSDHQFDETERSVADPRDDASATVAIEPKPDALCEPEKTLKQADCIPVPLTIVQHLATDDVTMLACESVKSHGASEATITVRPESPTPLARQYHEDSLPNIPDCEILGLLGSGEMGVVYKVREITLDRFCALKIARPSHAEDPAAILRQQKEGKAYASISNPYVIRIHRTGLHNGAYYLVLEYSDRGSLKSNLDGTPWSGQRAANLVKQLANGLHAIHSTKDKLIHRDLKPANILIFNDGTPDGCPKIADLGLVKSGTPDQSITLQGSIVGTPSYMSPEQAKGQSEEVGPHSDIYGLGAVLYELITGSPPFRGATIALTLNQVIQNDPVPPSRLFVGVQRDLETICLKCLEKKPSARYRTAHELEEDLDRFLTGRPIKARRVSLPERAVKWMRRRPATAAMIFAFVLMLISTMSAIVWSNIKAIEAAIVLTESSYDVRMGETKASLAGVEAGLTSKVLSNVAKLLSIDTKKRDPLELGALAVEAFGKVDVREILRLRTYHDGNAVRSIDFSADSRYLASSGFGGRLHVWDIAQQKSVTVVDDPDFNFHTYSEDSASPAVKFDASGSGLWYATHANSVVWFDPLSPELKRKKIEGWMQPCGLASDRSGERLTISWNDGWMSVHDIKSGKMIRTVTDPRSWYRTPVAMSADGKWVAYVGQNFQVKLFEVDSNKPPRVVGRHSNDIRSIAFSPDGKSLATASNDERARVWSLESEDVLELYTLAGHTARLNAIAFHPSGKILATASDDRTIRLWDARIGEEILVIRPDINSVLALAFSPDGRSLAAGHETICILELIGLDVRTKLRGLTHEVKEIAFFRDKPGTVVIGSADYGLSMRQLANVNRSIPLYSPPDTNAPLGGLALSRSGLLVHGRSRYEAADEINPNFAVRAIQFSNEHIFADAPVFEGHNSPVEHLLFDPGDQRLASGAQNGRILVWDTNEKVDNWRKVIFELEPDGQSVVGLGFSGPNLLVVASQSGLVRVFDLARSQTEALVGEKKIAHDIGRIVVSKSGEILYISGGNGTLSSLKLPMLEPIHTKEKTHSAKLVSGLDISPDGKLLVSGGDDRKVVIHDASTFEELFCLPSYDGEVRRVAFSPEGKYLAVGGVEMNLDVWDIEATIQQLGSLGLSHGKMNPGISYKDRIRDDVPVVLAPPSPIQVAWEKMGEAEDLKEMKGFNPKALANQQRIELNLQNALKDYGEAIAIWKKLDNESDSLFIASELAVSYAALANLQAKLKRDLEAKQSLDRAIQICERLRSHDGRVTIARARVFALASEINSANHDRYVKEAIIACREAMAQGYTDSLDSKVDLESLRDQKSFQKLRGEKYDKFGWSHVLHRGRARSIQNHEAMLCDVQMARKELARLTKHQPSDPWLNRNWALSEIDLAAAEAQQLGEIHHPDRLTTALKDVEKLGNEDREVVIELARGHALLCRSADDLHGKNTVEALKKCQEIDPVLSQQLRMDPAIDKVLRMKPVQP